MTAISAAIESSATSYLEVTHRIERGPKLPSQSWLNRHQGVEDEAIRSLAFWLWEHEGSPDNDRLKRIEEWNRARWMIERLKPSIVLDVANHPQAVASALHDLTRAKVGDVKHFVPVIVALDGAPEHWKECYSRFCKATLDRAPSVVAEEKDARFYRMAYSSFRLYQASFIDQPAVAVDNLQPVGLRAFQDACVVVFTGENALERTLCSALDLNRILARWNEEEAPGWADRIHARFAIGGTWSGCAACLPYVWRDEIGVDQQTWEKIPEKYKELLLAAGLTIGPSPLS